MKKLKIAQLVSNLHRVSSSSNQAIYSHVAWLTNKLVKQGHEVSLFAAGNSETKANLVSVTKASTSSLGMSEDMKKNYIHLLVSKCYGKAKDFDIIHSHFNLISSFYSGLVETPTLQSIHSPITENMKELLLRFKNNRYISFSLAQRKMLPELNWFANIYHGVDTKIFSYNENPKDYFLFLGRITEEKGVHLAIKAAKAAGVPLIIAGKSYPEEGYWHKEIEKNIDGKKIQYVGEAGFKEKIELYRNAKALLFPTQYDEVFGLVMIEAMACGTPVIGWKKGSVSEVIADKKTGFVVDNVSDLVNAIKAIDFIDRRETRKRAELYFSADKMVSGYEKIYSRIIEENIYKKEKKHLLENGINH